MTLRSERGMTLIELMVAMMVVTVGTLATLATYAHFSKATRRAQQQAVLTAVAQSEIEQLRAVRYDKLALTGPPSAAAATEAPLTGPAATEPIVTGGVVRPGGDDFALQQKTGRIYRYVTQRNEACSLLTAHIQASLATLLGQSQSTIASTLPGLCLGGVTSKRITVVVVPTSGDLRGALRLSTIRSNPDGVLGGVSGPAALALKAAQDTIAFAASAADTVLTQQLDLTDARCSRTRRDVPTSHPTDNTSQVGYSCNATGPAPRLATPEVKTGTVGDPLEDYSTDLTRFASGGLVLLRDTQAGDCTSASALVYPEPDADRRKLSLHSWATVASPGTVETAVSDGRATVSLWSSTASGDDGPGRMCVTLRRASTGAVVGSSELLLPSWPGEPTELVTSFTLDHTTLALGDRFVLTVRVPSDSGSNLRILYDHPAYRSTLAVTTQAGKGFL